MLSPNGKGIAEGGDLELQMFGLTTKFQKMQKDSINHETPAIGNVLLAVRASGIMIDVNPFNDDRWSKERGIKEVYPFSQIKCYYLGGDTVTFKKPKQDECMSVVLFDVIGFGVRSYKVKNWEDLPTELPVDLDFLKVPFFGGKVKIA